MSPIDNRTASNSPDVPIIDLAHPSQAQADALDAACREHGFFLISGHGADDLIERMWAETRRFFDAGSHVWEPLRRTLDAPMGFNDRELTKRKRDHKAVFDYLDPNDESRDAHNKWPSNLDGFREVMAEFHTTFTALTQRTLALLHNALELGEESIQQMTVDGPNSTVRLNHYPIGDPVPEDQRNDLAELGETALGYHTDPGLITLLLQDDTGGLQTQRRDETWIDVPPIPGTIVVNLGDAIQVQSNDYWRAAVHRVVPMTSRRRFSIPYFGNPSRITHVQPLTEAPGAARYRPFEWREFMTARSHDNYADLGAEDTQISDYLISNEPLDEASL